MANEVIIVTGGTRGIGRATSICLSQSGYQVVALFARNKSLARNLEASFTNITTKQVNITSPSNISDIIKEIELENNKIVGLVNNAGVVNDGYFLMMSSQKWRSVLDVNLDGTFHVLKSVLMHMKVNHIHGSVVNVSSTSGLTGQVGQANYSASKGALISLTKTLAKEMAENNIRVNAVSPGFVETDMTAKLKNKTMYEQFIPLKRFGKPEEIAYVIEFLLSAKSSYLTGKNITVDGGMIND